MAGIIPDSPVTATIPRMKVLEGGDESKIVSNALSQTTNGGWVGDWSARADSRHGFQHALGATTGSS